MHQAHCGGIETTRKEYYFIKTGLKMCSFTEGRKRHSKKHICSASLIPRNPEESSSHKISIEPGSTERSSNSTSVLSHFSSRMVSTEKVCAEMGSSPIYCVLKALLYCIIKPMCACLYFKDVVLQCVLS